MSNYCNNYLNISGSIEEINSLLNAVRGKNSEKERCFSFQEIIPCPMGWDYDWCCKNWGTKWDAVDPEVLIGENNATFYFESAWTPPTPVIKALTKMYPSLRFDHEYWEPGDVYYGHEIYENGDITFSYIPSCDEEEEAICIYKDNGCYYVDEYEDAVENLDAEEVNYAITIFRKYNLISDGEIPARYRPYTNKKVA